MAIVCGELFGMKNWAAQIVVAAGALLFLAVAGNNRAQQLPIGHATDFTSLAYFEPPDDQKVQMKLSGAEASPLPGGLLDVKQLQVEMFNRTNASPVVVVHAPQCTYAPLDGVANSPGHLELMALDGKFHTEGDGFLWRQTEQTLTISNRVHTTIAVDIFSNQKTAL
jgi:hypothetical protein